MGVKPIVKREALVFGLNLPCLFVIDTKRRKNLVALIFAVDVLSLSSHTC